MQSIAEASLQSPAWLLAQAQPRVDKQLAWLDFEPLNGLREMAFPKQTRAGAEQGAGLRAAVLPSLPGAQHQAASDPLQETHF